MRHLTNDLRHQIRRHGRGTSRVLALFLALTMVTSLGLDISTINTVYASESDTYTCGQEAHEHSIKNGCYALTCDEEETNGHTHTLDCYEDVDPTCGIEASDPVEEHHHDLDCYGDKVLTCESEDEDHEHTLECYDLGDPTCGIEETDGSEGHTHDLSCYKDAEAGCGKEETDGHKHTEDCYNLEETICGKEEHEHTDECKASDDEPETDHVANADYDKQWTKAADEALEDIDDDQIAALVAVAQSQVGYTEQIKDDTDEDIYTLYAHEFYNGNNDSQDWNTVFAMWALDKADISLDSTGDSEDENPLPVRNKLSAWIDAVDDTDSYISVVDDGLSELAQGDIAFLDLDGDEEPDYAAIVTSVQTDDDDYPNAITVVAGDIDAETLSYLTDAADDDGDVDTDADTADTVAEITLDGAEYDDDAGTFLAAIVTAFVQTSDYADEAAEPEDPVDEDANTNEMHGWTYSSDDSESTTDAQTIRKANALAPASNDAITGVDMSNYLNAVKYEKKDGAVWKESATFTTDDQVKATLSFDSVKTETIKANGNTLYVQLPDIIDCSRFTGVYETTDGSVTSGTYQYQQIDGHWYIVLTLTDEYVNKAGTFIGGALEFNFTWDKTQVPEEGTTKDVIIGNQTAHIKIEKGDGGDSGSSYKYSLYKEAGSVEWSSDKKTAYITYKVHLTVNEASKAPITLKDVLSGEGFAYDDKISITGDGLTVNFKDKSDQKTSIEIWPSSGSVVPKGTYTVEYRVKTTVEDASSWNIENETLSNEISSTDEDDNTVSSKTWTTVTTGTVDKQGHLVSGTDATYIDYTVYLNSGTLVKDLKEPAKFTDTIPSQLELVGDVTVRQYTPDGTLENTTTVKAPNGTINYETPTGQYYYIITYRTKVKDSTVIPAEGLTIKNTGTSTGGIDDSDSSEVTVPSNNLDKSYVSESFKKIDDTWYDVIKWTSKVDVEGSLEGYIYEDWSSINSGLGDPWFAEMEMTDAQRAAIVVKNAKGEVVDSDKYNVTASNHAQSGIANGLFKIEFSEDVIGPVTIEYETRANMTRFTEGGTYTFYNYASLTKDGTTVYDQAQTSGKQYRTDYNQIIYKYGGEWQGGSPTEGTTTLNPGQDYITWTILVNEGKTMKGTLVVTDEIKEGLKLDESSIKVKTGGKDGYVIATSQNISNPVSNPYISWTYKDNLLTFTIKEGAYVTNGSSTNLAISFNTYLPDDFTGGSKDEKVFSNTATVKTDDGEETPSTFDETVKRQIVGKSGTYDKENQILTYQIILNPDASHLGDGTPLKVTDTLDAGSLADYIELDSIELFTAVKTTNSSGETEVKAGQKIKDLTLTDSLEADDTDHYAWYPTKTITNDDGSQETVKNVFETYIPDATAYVAIVNYHITYTVSDTVTMNNKVEIEGDGKWNKTDSGTKAEQYTGGRTYTGHQFKVIKRDLASYTTLLSGAEFNLEEYGESGWSSVATLTTGDKGEAALTSNVIGTGKIYRLVETKAPSGYLINGTTVSETADEVKDPNPTYFIVLEGDKATLPENLPEGVTPDNITIYRVETGKYANIVVDRYDPADTSIVDNGQVSVSKVWIDGSGDQVTGASLADMPNVQVTLTKQVKNKGHKFALYVTGNSLVLDDDVNDGGYVLIAMENQQPDNWKSAIKSNGFTDISVEKTEQTYQGKDVYKIGPITSDVWLVNAGNLIYYYGTYWKSEGGTPTTSTTDTVIGTVTLNNSNSWSYKWTGLATGDGISYKLTETAIDGYTIGYSSTNTSLTTEGKFTPSSSGDAITVTNTSAPSYELPSTGGVGTLPYMLGGSAALISSMFAGCSMRRRRRDERRCD